MKHLSEAIIIIFLTIVILFACGYVVEITKKDDTIRYGMSCKRSKDAIPVKKHE